MPLLAAFLSTIFGSLFGWLGTYLTKRAATYVALTVLVAAAAAAAYAAIMVLVNGVLSNMPSLVTVGFSWFLPPNFAGCVAAIFGIEVVVAGYRWHKETVRASAGIA